MKDFYQGGQYVINLQQIRLDIFRLLSYISLAKDIFHSADQTIGNSTTSLWTQFAESEITSVLIASSIRIRVLLEQLPKIDTSTFICGGTNVNFQDPMNNKSEKLDLREACNKIIHAKKIRFEQGSHQSVFLYGDKSGVLWKTNLNVSQFAEYVSSLTQKLDQSP